MPHLEIALQSDSLERVVPNEVETGDVTGEETLALHLQRYEFAAGLARPGRLLDISCGVGYGTRLLVKTNPQITEAVGVDISAAAIDYARAHYQSDRIEYVEADATQFTSEMKFDTIVSLETVEHLPEPVEFIQRLVGLLNPGGVLISSVPTTPSVDANPHHLHDFTERSFRKIFLRHGMTERDCFRQIQPFQLMPLLTKKETRANGLRRNLLWYYVTHPLSAFRRLSATVRYGFQNRYITIAWQKGD